MTELSKEVERQISAIFSTQLSNRPNLTSSNEMAIDVLIQLNITRLKGELISYCKRQQNCVISIARYDSDNQWLSSLTFRCYNTTDITHASKLEITISETFDSFEVFEIMLNKAKKSIFKFKMQ